MEESTLYPEPHITEKAVRNYALIILKCVELNSLLENLAQLESLPDVPHMEITPLFTRMVALYNTLDSERRAPVAEIFRSAQDAFWRLLDKSAPPSIPS